MNKKDRQQNQEFSLTQSSSADDHSSEVEPLLDDSTAIRSGDRSLSINHNEQNVVTDIVALAAQSEWTRRTVDDLALLVSNNFNTQQAQNSLQLHTHILESMAEGVVISDSYGTIIFSNSKFDSMFGYSPGELLGLPLMVLNDLPPQENQRFVDGIMATLKQEGSWSGEICNRQQDGTPFLTEARASALQLNGKTYLIGIQQDITERKRTEQRLATQCAIACTLAMATTLDDAIPEILQSLCQSLDWQLAAFWFLDRPSQQLSCCHIWHRPTLDAREFIDISQVASLTAGVGLPGEVLASHQPIWISDIQAEPNFPRAIWANRVGLRSAFAFPILIGQDCLGVIECYHERPQHPDPNLLHCMTAIGGQIGQFMERLYAEGSLTQSEKRYRTIFETVGISLWEEDFSDVKSLLDNLKQQGITDLQAYLQDHPSVIEEAIQRVKLCDVNQQSLKLFGAQSKAELLASLETVFVPETKQIFMEEMIALAAGQSYFEAETTMQTLQGERRHILFTMTFPPDAASYKQVLVSVLDISDRVRAEQECQRLLQQEIILREAAEASKRVRDEFLTVLSHELRTPLHLILAWATLIQQGTVSAEELPQVLDTIVRNAQHQVQMVTDLLDLSQILQGQFKLMIRPVDLKDPIEEALQTVQLAAQAKSIQIQTQLDPNVGLVLGDSKRLQQIIWNLLSNAIKFTPNDGNPTGRIEVRLEQVDNQVQMTIADTGKGIAPDLLPYLFQRFYQEDSTITRKFGGLGIGLSIVRHLVELHGGTVSVNSAGLGRGATFIVKLPVMARQDG